VAKYATISKQRPASHEGKGENVRGKSINDEKHGARKATGGVMISKPIQKDGNRFRTKKPDAQGLGFRVQCRGRQLV